MLQPCTTRESVQMFCSKPTPSKLIACGRSLTALNAWLLHAGGKEHAIKTSNAFSCVVMVTSTCAAEGESAGRGPVSSESTPSDADCYACIWSVPGQSNWKTSSAGPFQIWRTTDGCVWNLERSTPEGEDQSAGRNFIHFCRCGLVNFEVVQGRTIKSEDPPCWPTTTLLQLRRASSLLSRAFNNSEAQGFANPALNYKLARL